MNDEEKYAEMHRTMQAMPALQKEASRFKGFVTTQYLIKVLDTVKDLHRGTAELFVQINTQLELLDKRITALEKKINE